jgi:hypothetical protein
MSTTSKQSGYTLLFAVLVSVLVLGVAVFISGIARKQYILSSTALDSMYSFYAADSGIECVAASGVPSSTAPMAITCNTQSQTPSYSTITGVLYSDQNPASQVSEATNVNFGFYPQGHPTSLTGCTVIKIDVYQNTAGGWSDVVQSRGYNLCTSSSGSYGPNTSSPRTVERALQLNTEL